MYSAPNLAISDVIYLGPLVLIRSQISFLLDRQLGQLRQALGESMLGEKPGHNPHLS